MTGPQDVVEGRVSSFKGTEIRLRTALGPDAASVAAISVHRGSWGISSLALLAVFFSIRSSVRSVLSVLAPANETHSSSNTSGGLQKLPYSHLSKAGPSISHF